MKTALIAFVMLALVCPLSADTSCFKIYDIGQSKKVGLRNTCDTCKIAVVNFNYFNGKHEEKEFKVPGKSSIEIDITGSKRTEVIDQKDCKEKKK